MIQQLSSTSYLVFLNLFSICFPDSEAPDVVVVTPELGVPGLHSSAPLYHRLQQYRVSSGEIASLERKTRGERETGGERVCVREAEEMEEDPLPPLPHSTTSPAPPSLDSEPAEVYIIFHISKILCVLCYVSTMSDSAVSSILRTEWCSEILGPGGSGCL